MIIPEIGERYELPAGLPARRITTGRPEVQGILSEDWQNDYADFAVQLKRRLKSIDDERARREALGRMRRVLDAYGKGQAAS